MDNELAFILHEVEKIQTIPAPTFNEQNRGEYLFNRFKKFKLQSVEIDTIGNVYGFLPGGAGEPLVISAHLDTVHSIDVDHSIIKTDEIWTGPGIGDNTLALATLLGLLDYFKSTPISLEGGIWFVANVSEEGLGNLNGIKKVVDRFSDQVRAYLVLEGLGLGVIFNKGLGVRRIRVSINTAGGHSWGDHGNPSAIHELARFIVEINSIKLPASPRSSINVGTIQGGTTINSIASHATCDIDVRSVDEMTLHWIMEKISRTVDDQISSGAVFHVSEIGSRPNGETADNHWLVRLAVQSLNRIDINPILAIGSTDASYPMSKQLPAICVSITQGGNVHTTKEYIELGPIRKGLEQILYIIHHAWDQIKT